MNSTPVPEPLFQFELAPVEKIEPWSDSDGQNLSLSLYALTDGHFRIAVGKETLLRYTPAVISHWGLSHEDANYQVACFASDLLELVSAATSPLPPLFENLVRDEVLLRQLQQSPVNPSLQQVPVGVITELEVAKSNKAFKQGCYEAFRWLGERSIWLNYLGVGPNVLFVRVRNEVWIRWDNTNKKIEGMEVWTARVGTYCLSVGAFLDECHSFAERLLAAMESRIASIENGSVHAQIPLDAASLRGQLVEFKSQFDKALSATYRPDIDWETAEKAMRALAGKQGLTLPV